MDNNKIDIQRLFSELDVEMSFKLSGKIGEIHHPTARGDEAELNWIGLLKTYLPERYKVDSGFVVDHKGSISEQIDIIIYDRHFTPFIFRGKSTSYIPAEGVYAVFEVKPHFNKTHYDYATKKLESVRKLKRTSVPFSHIQGKDTKELSDTDIIGGILTKKNKSRSCFDKINEGSDLTFVLCLDYGIKIVKNNAVEKKDKEILAFFLLKLIEKLRLVGSVPALDVNKYLEFVK